MDATTPATGTLGTERRFREATDDGSEGFVEIGLTTDGPLEVNMTDEPGSDPYNHTGRFRRMFR